jgi:hypothetical protein
VSTPISVDVSQALLILEVTVSEHLHYVFISFPGNAPEAVCDLEMILQTAHDDEDGRVSKRHTKMHL